MTRPIEVIKHELEQAKEWYINYDGAKSTRAATLGTVLRLRDELNMAEAEEFLNGHIEIIRVEI
jgi:hypothetical protein